MPKQNTSRSNNNNNISQAQKKWHFPVHCEFLKSIWIMLNPIQKHIFPTEPSPLFV